MQCLRYARVRKLPRPAFAPIRSLATTSNLVLRQAPSALHLSGSSLPPSGLTLPFEWLRDTCQCTECIHPSTKQKRVRTGDIVKPVPRAAGIAEGNSALQIDWDGDEHRSLYPIHFLTRYGDTSGQTRQSSDYDDIIARRAWCLSDLPDGTIIDYQSLEADPLPGFLQILRYGLLVVRGLPHENTSKGQNPGSKVEELAKTLGFIRETFYGKLWDVVSKRGSTNIAYTDLYLDLHMDLMYMQHPPHIQLLHCIKNRVQGGTSVFVDAIKAANDLWHEDRDAFKLLADTPIPFHYENDGHHLHHAHPTIQLASAAPRLPNHPPAIAHINYSPPFQAPLPTMTPTQLYSALRKYSDLLARPSGRFEHTLAEGDCAIFDNRRVLHARTAFWDEEPSKPDETNRWLKGCYVEMDDLMDRTRGLLAKRGSP